MLLQGSGQRVHNALPEGRERWHPLPPGLVLLAVDALGLANHLDHQGQRGHDRQSGKDGRPHPRHTRGVDGGGGQGRLSQGQGGGGDDSGSGDNRIAKKTLHVNPFLLRLSLNAFHEFHTQTDPKTCKIRQQDQCKTQLKRFRIEPRQLCT